MEANVVLAGGVLCWRLFGDQLQVLLIYRKNYGDWSWPKGKKEVFENVAQTAVREVFEEVGLCVRLGISLGEVRYGLGGSKNKVVHYWAGRVLADAAVVVDGVEVDSFRWCSVVEAKSLLTFVHDVLPLQRLEEAFLSGLLDSYPVLVVRHGKAVSRSVWNSTEGSRPLTKVGAQQALAMSKLLLCWNPAAVFSSPWLRCLATVANYAQSMGVSVEEVVGLTEFACKEDKASVVLAVEKILGQTKPVLFCTHRPVLSTVFEVFGKYCVAGLADFLPGEDPYLEPGEVLVAQVVHNVENGRIQIVSVAQYKPVVV